MISKIATLGVFVTALVSTMCAQEGSAPKGVPNLDHVFVIMMENHGYSQILNNPNVPFINQYAKTHNVATNYFAIAHPSLTNYLEIVGGSNFILEPIFEADMPQEQHAYRQNRNAQSAVREVLGSHLDFLC